MFGLFASFHTLFGVHCLESLGKIIFTNDISLMYNAAELLITSFENN